MKLQATKQKAFVFLGITVFITAFGFQGLSYAQSPAEVLIYTGDVSWMSQADGVAEAETTKSLLQSAGITAEITEDENDVKEWMLQTTSNGSLNVLILYGLIPTSIYPAGNTMPDGSVAEKWIETTDGNTILNHADYFGFWSTAKNNNNGQVVRIGNYYGSLRNLMDNPKIFIPINGSVDNLQMFVTNDGSTLTPSLVNFKSDRPIYLGHLQGDWFAEKILASNTGTAQASYADPVVLRDGDLGRIAIVHQTAFEDNPKGEVAAELIINYLLAEGVDAPLDATTEDPLPVEMTLTATTTVPLTEATLHGSTITLVLTGGIYEERLFAIEHAVNVSGVPGVTIGNWQGVKRWGMERVSDTELKVQLQFSGNIDTDATLTFTVESGAIAGYNGNVPIATLPVTAMQESLDASTESPLTEATLHGSTITLTLTGRRFPDEWSIERSLSFSGIDGVTFKSYDVDRVSDTEVTIKLGFAGNIDEDTILTLTIGTDAIVGGYDKPFTFQFPVTAVIGESLEASTESPLTEATLHWSTISLLLTGRRFVEEYYIDDALSVSGIEGVAVYDVDRVNDTEATVRLQFTGNIDADAILTLTVGTGAIGYNKDLTFQFPVTAVEESLDASTEAPLTERTLHGSIITLTLTGRRFPDEWSIERSLSVSGIEGVTVGRSYEDGVDRISGTEATVYLEFSGNIDTDATLTLTVGPDAIRGYEKSFTFQFPVTAVEESLEASTAAPLTEATLSGSIITLNLTGRRFPGDEQFVGGEWYIANALSVSGIDGVTLAEYGDPVLREVGPVIRMSDTEAIVILDFAGNIDIDATLTLTVGADAIEGYDKDFTFQFPVTAVEESLEASTETPLTETMLNGGIITLTLTGRRFADRSGDIKDALSVSGIDGVTLGYGNIYRPSDTEAIVELEFDGNIDTDATLTLTVGADAIGYDKDFTFEFPVTPIEESLIASTEFPLTEATLDDSIITLSLSGRRFDNHESTIGYALSVSGIEGVTVAGYGAVHRVSDTVATFKLAFDVTDFDTDATLTVTIGADAIAGYNRELTAQIPVTAIKQSNAILSISPASVISPGVGKELTFDLNIKGGENVAGYQATVSFSRIALSLVNITNGDYLPEDTFFLPRGTKLVASTLAGAANGDGKLATLTFKVEYLRASTLTLDRVYLVDANGKRWEVATQSAEVTILPKPEAEVKIPPEPENAILGDLNRDGVVNIQDLVIVSVRFGQTGNNIADINGDHLVDIVDLVLVASAIGEGAASPPLNPQALEPLTIGDIQRWLSQARQLTLTDPAYLRGITILEQLLKTLTPKKSVLLPNYPNPFNPETWIPYHLSNDVDVQISIYDTKGVLVRRLELGYQMAGYYTDRTKAAYWNGKNESGEQVASGVYFYHLSAGDYSATRRMLILK